MGPRETGSVLDGKYEIVRRLGSGGMGEVYLSRHLHLQELRVIKILRQDLAADPSAQKRFLREARLATQIKHPNVAILYDYSRLPDGSFYMVWEHIEGQDVGDRIRRVGPFPVPVAIQLGIQALRGLEAIHSTGVIHRDLSPDNLMITEDRRGQYRVKIIDLGLAKDLGPEPNFEITQVGMFMGKLQYCSPEQAGAVSGESLDRRSDLYSFGLVLYEMICGLPPFDSENQHGFIFKRLSEDPLPLVGRRREVDVPVELDKVVRRALERDREQRYPDALSFILALEKVGQALAAAETQEIPVQGLAPRPRPGAAAPPRQKSSGELSREERSELLAQIERASARVREGSQVITRAQAALELGRLDEAREMARQMEAGHPRAAGLEELKNRIAQAEERARRGERIRETEKVLAGYLEKRQLPLARLALETLLELEVAHPRRADYEARVAALAQEVERGRLVEEAAAAARAALGRGDPRTARRELEVVIKNDPSGEHVAALQAEFAAAERRDRESVDLGACRRRLEALLESRKVALAERELEELARLDVPRVTIDAYRARIAEARSAADAVSLSTELEQRYRQSVEKLDWYDAREAAQELAAAVPASPRPTAMLAEIEQLETRHRRRQAIEQGVRQLEGFLERKEVDKAELALKVLLQMDPENRHRKRLEKQVKALRGG